MGIYERRSKDKEKRLNLIMVSAEELIVKEGFKNFTLSRLSEKIEYSRGIIYYYFKNEENIIAKLISDKMIKLLGNINRIPEGKDGFTDIKKIIETFRLFLEKEEPNYLSLISYFTTRIPGRNEMVSVPFYTEYEDLRDAIFTKCLNAIEKGINDGSIFSGIDPYMMTYCIWAGIGSFWEYMMKDNVLRPLKKPYSKQASKFINAYFTLIYKALRA